MTKLLVLAIVSLALATACGGSGGGSQAVPEATRVPEATPAGAAVTATVAPPTEPAAPTATTAPSPTTAAAPTTAPAPTVPPAPTQPAAPANPPAASAPVTLNVVAQNIVFDRQSITVPANTQVTVNFQNNDNSVPHDFGVSLPGVAHTVTCNGPCSGSITFNSGVAGRYTFQCSVHANMVGDFIVQ